MNLNPEGLRSLISREESFVRFCNACGDAASIIWYDFKGERILYCFLKPGQYIDMKTFVTHPWIFEKTSTGDWLVGNSLKTFFPEPLQHARRVVNITLPMYSLKERSLQVIRDNFELADEDDWLQLELPQPLKEELKGLKVKKCCAIQHIANHERATDENSNDNSCGQCMFHSFHQAEFAQYIRY